MNGHNTPRSCHGKIDGGTNSALTRSGIGGEEAGGGENELIYYGLPDLFGETNGFSKVGKTNGCQLIIDTGPGGRSSSQGLLLLITRAV